MQDMEIENGGQLVVRESQLAVFVNEGRIADVFGPGLHTLVTRNLPVLTDLMNWSKDFQSPFKSDVYFFSTRLATRSEVGHCPLQFPSVTSEYGAVRLRALWQLFLSHCRSPALFFNQGQQEPAKSFYDSRSRKTAAGRLSLSGSRPLRCQPGLVPQYGSQSGRAGRQSCRQN